MCSIAPLSSVWNEFLHWLKFVAEPADNEGNEGGDANVEFVKSATVLTGSREPWVHLGVFFSIKMNPVELMFLF